MVKQRYRVTQQFCNYIYTFSSFFIERETSSENLLLGQPWIWVTGQQVHQPNPVHITPHRQRQRQHRSRRRNTSADGTAVDMKLMPVPTSQTMWLATTLKLRSRRMLRSSFVCGTAVKSTIHHPYRRLGSWNTSWTTVALSRSGASSRAAIRASELRADRRDTSSPTSAPASSLAPSNGHPGAKMTVRARSQRRRGLAWRRDSPYVSSECQIDMIIRDVCVLQYLNSKSDLLTWLGMLFYNASHMSALSNCQW